MELKRKILVGTNILQGSDLKELNQQLISAISIKKGLPKDHWWEPGDAVSMIEFGGRKSYTRCINLYIEVNFNEDVIVLSGNTENLKKKVTEKEQDGWICQSDYYTMNSGSYNATMYMVMKRKNGKKIVGKTISHANFADISQRIGMQLREGWSLAGSTVFDNKLFHQTFVRIWEK